MKLDFFSNRIKTFVFILLVILQANLVHADSPLTTTPFWRAYQDISEVKLASSSKGILREELIDFLVNPHCYFSEKAALINAIGWSSEGRHNNAVRYYRSLVARGSYNGYRDFFKRGAQEELLLYAYLKAMDSYTDVRFAARVAEQSLKRGDVSESEMMIVTLIRAQKFMGEDWSKIASLRDKWWLFTPKSPGLREEARRIVYDYLVLY